jgi:hypothetical protein
MRKTKFFLLFIFLYLTGASQTWVSFTDSTVSFTARYPSGWTLKMKEEKRVFFTSPADDDKDIFRENINIGVKSNPEYGTSLSIEELLPGVIESLKTRIKGFQKTADRLFTFNNAQAAELKYTGIYDINGNDAEISITQWFCFWKQRLYTITYTSLKGNTRHDAEARKIMESIRFRD